MPTIFSKGKNGKYAQIIWIKWYEELLKKELKETKSDFVLVLEDDDSEIVNVGYRKIEDLEDTDEIGFEISKQVQERLEDGKLIVVFLLNSGWYLHNF